MKIEKKQENSKFIEFLNFPKHLNLLALTLIIVAYGLLIGFGISCAVQNKDYIVIPNFEEMSYSNQINPFIKLYSNYTVNSGDENKPADEVEVYKTDAMSFCYYGIDNQKATSIDAWVTGLFDDGSIYYYPQKTYSSKTGTKTGVQNLTSGTKQEKYPTNFYCDFSYFILNTDGTNTEIQNTEQNVKFQIKILQLTKKDKEKNETNEFAGATYVVNTDTGEKTVKIFKTFAITNVYDSDEKVNKITSKLVFNSEAAKKYVFNLQLFAIDSNGELYNLIGFYNLSNNTLLTYSNTSKVSRNIDIDYIYAKATYLDETGKTHELFYKTNFNNL